MTVPTIVDQLERTLQQSAGVLAEMQTSVAAGELRLDPAVGQAFVKALDEAIQATLPVRWALLSVANPAALGSNAVSMAMAGKFAGRADGSDRALSPQLRAYHDQSSAMKAAAEAAMRAYDSTEASATNGFGGE